MSTKSLPVLVGLLGAFLTTTPAASAPSGVECGLPRQPGCVAWAGRQRVPGNPEHNWGKAVATAPDGGLVFVTSNGTDLAYEAATGRLRWTAPNGTTGTTGSQDIGVSPSGSVVASAGESTFPDPERVVSGEVVVTAHDPGTGARRWQARHRAANNDAYTAGPVAVTDSRVFVAGRHLLSGELVILAFDAGSGRKSWVARHAPVRPDPVKPVGIVASPDGRRVFVTGLSWHDRPYVQWVTVAYDGTSGEQLWVARHSGGAESASQPNGIALHPGGDLVYVTGWGRRPPGPPGGGFVFRTIAYDATSGRPAWSGDWSSGANSDSLASSVDISPDGGRLYVAGYGGSPVPGYWIEARDALGGGSLWSSPLPLLAPTQDQEGLFGFTSVRSSPDGRAVYVAVSAHDQTAVSKRDISYGVTAFDPTAGKLLWRGTYTDPGAVEASYPKGFAVDPDGRRVYVTGRGWKRGGGFVQTVAFVAGQG